MPIDYKRYPDNWKDLRKQVLKRAGQGKTRPCCEFCGQPNHSTVYSVGAFLRENGRYKLRRIWFSSEQAAERFAGGSIVKKVKVVLTIAHLDHDEENPDVKIDRLAALCQYCHLNYDANEKWRRQLENWENKTKQQKLL